MRIKFFFAAIVLIASLASARAQSTKNSTVQLPEGCIIESGLIKAKQGFHFLLSSDRKTATLVNAKNNIAGTFNCSCAVGKSGNCGILQTGEAIKCLGDCGCSMFTTSSGGIKYSINLSTGVIKKI
jgi:hypothetical protein